MPAAKIFLSHSTKTPVARRYLDAVSDALSADPRFEVLLDKKHLQGGDDWRRHIYSWMGKAHGAVLLLSEEALHSLRVLTEASILEFRRSLEELPLIPVLVGDVQREDTQSGVIGDIVNRYQYVRMADPADAAQEVATSLRRFFEDQKPRTASEIVEGRVASRLRDAGIKESDLTEVTEKIAGWPTDQVDLGAHDRVSAFARNLFRVDFETACTALCELAERAPTRIDDLAEVLDVVAPFWIEESVAAVIAERALHREHAKRLLAIDVEYPWTVRSHICRACLWALNTKWIYYKFEPPDDETEDGLVSLKRQFLENLDQLSPISWGQQALPKGILLGALKEIADSGRPLFVVLSRDWSVDRELLGGFREEFSTPAIVAMGSEGRLALPKAECHFLNGPDIDREKNAYVRYGRALLILGHTSR